jgi:Cof subfamily protein (haloacid dehalogenase superfamily)
MASQSGVSVIPASGRIAPSIRPFADQLGLDSSMVCCNGAHVLYSGNEIFHVGLCEEAIKIVVDYAFEEQEHLNLYCRDKLYFASDPRWGEVYLQRVSTIIPELLCKEEALTKRPTKMIIVADPDKMPKHHEVLSKKLQGLNTDLVFSEPEYLEFLPTGVNKATGLQAFAEHLGIAQTEVAAIGDYLNDLEMIQWAGLSAAVKNALPEIQQAAKIVVPSNDECGLATFIYEHVLKS